VGAGAGISAALLAAAGVALAGAGLELGARREHSALVLLPAAAIGPLLFAAFALAPLRSPPLSESLWGAGDAVALRLGAAAALLGACAFGAGWKANRRDPERDARRSAAVATIAALAAILVVDRPGMVALLLAGGGVATAVLLALRSRATPFGGAAAVVLALALTGAAGSAGEWIALRRASAERLASLLPPSEVAVTALGEEVEKALAELGHGRLPSSEELDLDGVASDLAYAIWRDSPLARSDLLSALTVVSPDGSRERFSYGLPIDGRGAIDSSAVRWVDLAPMAWRQRSRAGEVSVHGRLDEPWILRWAFVPRVGFEPAEQRAIEEPRRGVARAGRSLTLLPDLPAPVRAAIYGVERRPIATSWLEGTPPFDEQWRDAATAFRHRVLTPDGIARVAGERRDELAAALFVPIPTPFDALERGGVFVAGALLVALGVAVAAFALASPWRFVRAAARRTLRSYSRRLVLVVSACLLVPVITIYALVAHSLEGRLEREQEASALDALRSAQRVLGEYVLSLEPGFGVGTALDDRLLEWLARVIRNEIHLYWGSEIYASSKRDLFAAGLLPRRIPGDVWEKIHLGGERAARRITRSGADEYLEIYAPLEIPGLSADSTKLVLALPLLGRQEELTEEIAATRRRALLATLAVAALVLAAGSIAARRFTQPIEAIVAGTQRIAEGADELGYRPEETELEALAEAIDRMAARIADARRRLLVEKRLVERIVENVTAAVVGLDREGRVLFANRLARSLLGAAPGEELVRSLERRRVDTAVAALERAAAYGEPVAARVTIDDADREWTLVRVPLPGAGEPSELVVVEDVTDVVRAQRLDAWAAMARIIAHEIKNPLTPIRLSTEHLREAWQRDREHFAAVFERCTTNILEQVEELRRTASEFSLYSEIPRIEPQRGDLREAVAEIVEAYRAAPHGAATVELHAPASEVLADFDRRMLGRAVRNLIENAVRASASGGAVDVTVESADGFAAVRVADRGPGVSPDLLGRVLEPYFSTHAGGTGLGLPIARRVAEEHGGSLAVRNRTEGGFEVTIRIPLK